MARKGENIYKRKDGRWEGRYLKHVSGEKSRYGYVYAKTYREVRIKLREAAIQWEAQQPVILEEESLLLSAVASEWERHLVPQVKEITLVKYHTILHKHLLPALGDVSVMDMTHRKIEAFSRELLNTLAPRTVADVLGVLRSILRYAQQDGAEVPCDGSSVRIRRPPVEIRVLTPSEQTTLCRYLTADLTHRNAGILLSLYTGLRVGEVCALRWEDFVMEDGFLSCITADAVLGIDVSRYQGDIDWQQVKAAGVEFVMVRLGNRGIAEGTLHEDPNAKQNLQGAKAAGL